MSDPSGGADRPSAGHSSDRAEEPDQQSLTLLAEELTVGKQTVESGRLRVRTETHTRDASVDADLLREEAIIETIPKGHRIFAVPVARVEGDTTIIPVVEEVLHTEKHMILKEEIHVTRQRKTHHFHDTVALRHQEAVVSRSENMSERPRDERGQHVEKAEEYPMDYETLVAVYDTPAHADAAVKALTAAGFHQSDISTFDQARLKAGKPEIARSVKEAGLWQRLFGNDVYKHEAEIYGQTVQEGGAVISLRVPHNEVAHASAVLDMHRPVDVQDRAVTAGVADRASVAAIEKKIDATPLAPNQTVAVSPKLAAALPDVLRLAEEQLNVGKQQVETGRTRVRRFVTEREIATDVTLHDEHAEVLRKAITDPKYVGNIDWADNEIEVIETAEHALVSKTARIVEEVGLKKIGADHIETIRDKLRRQQAEVERIGPDGKVIPAKSGA